MFKQQYKIYLMMLGLSIGVSLGFQILLPSPFGFLAALGFFLAFPFIIQKKLQGKMLSIASKITVKYRCIVCQNTHKQDSCPRCGSKMKKADFG